jgi:hypothetical protein
MQMRLLKPLYPGFISASKRAGLISLPRMVCVESALAHPTPIMIAEKSKKPSI